MHDRSPRLKYAKMQVVLGVGRSYQLETRNEKIDMFGQNREKPTTGECNVNIEMLLGLLEELTIRESDPVQRVL